MVCALVARPARFAPPPEAATSSAGRTPFHQGNTLLDVAAISASDFVAVGEAGTILRVRRTPAGRTTYDLVQLESGSTLRAVCVVSETEMYAVGDGTTFVHFDGTQWSPAVLPTGVSVDTELRGISCLPDGTVFLAAGSSVVRIAASSGAVEFPLLRGQQALAVWALAADNIYVGTDAGMQRIGGAVVYDVTSTARRVSELFVRGTIVDHVVYAVEGDDVSTSLLVGRSGSDFERRYLVDNPAGPCKAEATAVWGPASSDELFLAVSNGCYGADHPLLLRYDGFSAPRVDLSLAYERVGKIEEAVAALEIFLHDAPPTTTGFDRAEVRLTELRARIERTTLVVQGGRRARPFSSTTRIAVASRTRTRFVYAPVRTSSSCVHAMAVSSCTAA